MDITNLHLFKYFIEEREEVRKKKEAGKPRPWTEDQILQNYHFCNVHREDDRGTKEIRAEVVRWADTKYLPMVYTAARMFNKASSLSVFLRKDNWLELLQDERARGKTVFHTAYVVSTCGKKMDKLEYLSSVVDEVSKLHVPDDSCEAAYSALLKVDGLGSFMAAQVVADLKNDRYLVDAPDKRTFCVIGPGSKKGMNFIFDGGTTPSNFERRIRELEEFLGREDIDSQDLQNCLCEFSKYMRYKLNLNGRIRTYA